MNVLERRISAAQLRLRIRNPFFASLALFARVRFTERVDTAATDGRDLYFNPAFVESLSKEELDGVLLHEVLHAALLHVSRRGERDPQRWNYAADVVVNAMVMAEGIQLPEFAVSHPEWDGRSVEEVYDLLQKNDQSLPTTFIVDLRGDLAEGDEAGSAGATTDTGAMANNRALVLRAHWRQALQQARVIARQAAREHGTAAGDAEREWAMVEDPQIDWRAELWRYLVQTPVDFAGYDRRFIYRGLYIDQMAGEMLNLWVAIDTSGSIDDDVLNKFMAELRGILSSYPNIRCHLYYADTVLYGPYELSWDKPLPAAKGGGGTSFVPFFDAVGRCQYGELPYVCVYLTDGYGTFPNEAPELPTLWLVTPGGLLNDEFPFGKVVRLLS